jgi:hypothetical protein
VIIAGSASVFSLIAPTYVAAAKYRGKFAPSVHAMLLGFVGTVRV